MEFITGLTGTICFSTFCTTQSRSIKVNSDASLHNVVFDITRDVPPPLEKTVLLRLRNSLDLVPKQLIICGQVRLFENKTNKSVRPDGTSHRILKGMSFALAEPFVAITITSIWQRVVSEARKLKKNYSSSQGHSADQS